VARRTVAQWREGLGIPAAHRRRRKGARRGGGVWCRHRPRDAVQRKLQRLAARFLHL